MTLEKMTLSARYCDGRWEVRRRDPGGRYGETYYFVDVREIVGWAPFQHADRDEADVLDYRVVIEFDGQEFCPVGKRGEQVLHSAWQDPSLAWGERAVEHVVTTGFAGEPFVAIHQINYPHDGPASFTSIQLIGAAAAVTSRHLAHLVESGAVSEARLPGERPTLCPEELPEERLPRA